MASAFGDTMRLYRHRANLSQRALAEAIGCDCTYISKIECGVMAAPSDDLMAKIAATLGVDLDQLRYLSAKVPRELRNALTDNELATTIVWQLSEHRLSEGVYRAILTIIDEATTE